MKINGFNSVDTAFWNVEEKDKFDIGRCRTAKLIIPNVNISRKHCQLSYNNFTWILQDISSSGTFLNDVLIGKGKIATIQNNDILRLGSKEYNFIWQFKINRVTGIDLEKNFNSKSKIFENENKEFRTEMDGKTEEKKETNEIIRKKLIELQDKIIQNGEIEEELKLEIQILQQKMNSGRFDLENKFLKEKRRLEQKIIEQEKLIDENLKARKTSELHERELNDKLKKEEEEKKILMHKLSELEEAKNILSQKLNEFNKMHLLNEARIEQKMQKELMRKETNMKLELKEQIESLRKSQIELEYHLKAEFEERGNVSTKEFSKELEGIKNTLSGGKLLERLLEKKLNETSSLKDESFGYKSELLENIAHLLETELQCSICSELFITAVTLNCTHTFCMYCINTWKKKKKNCPICRKKITSENRSIVMDNYIEKMVENLSDDFKCRRKAVVGERNEVVPKKKRMISSSCAISDSNHRDLTSSL